MGLDFQKWAIVSPNNETGFGRMAMDAQKILGIPYHFITPSTQFKNKAPQKNQIELDKQYCIEELCQILAPFKLQAVLMFEHLNWCTHLRKACIHLGIKMVCVPMWEWFNGKNDMWKDAHLLIFPSTFAAKALQGFPYPHVVLPWVLDLEGLPSICIQGPATIFGHNAGIIDHQDRKGTLETISSFSKIKNPNLRLILRFVHSELPLPKLDKRIIVESGSLSHHSHLFKGIDAAIQPSKMEGIGFMVLEPVCSGLPTITLNYPPMNTYTQNPLLLVKKSLFKRRAIATTWNPNAHLYLPNIQDLKAKIEWASKNDLSSISKHNRSWAETFFEPKSLLKQWSESLMSYF